jgi:hypothetical protein
MNVLFIARHFTYFRNFEPVIAVLADRGHRVHLAADREEALGGRDLVDRLASRYPGQVTVGFTPILQWGRYRRLSNALRIGLDYLRYSDPRYEATPKIRERAYERTPLLVLALAKLPFRGLLTRILAVLERAVPRQTGVDDFISEHKADVLLITPLIELGSPQLDYMRAARALGIRSALCVWSWDHLSSKALIRVVPDKVIVWNSTQRDEAERFHGIPADRVVVTGAQCFDQWFDRTPTRDRDAFCRRVGLTSARSFLLYVCSALFRGSPSEAVFVLRWIASIRQSSDAGLREMPIPKTLLALEGNGLFNNPPDPALVDPKKPPLPPGPYGWKGNSYYKDANGNYRFVYSGADARRGLNVNAIILEIPLSYITKAPQSQRIVNVWSESWVLKASNKAETIPDRSGFFDKVGSWFSGMFSDSGGFDQDPPSRGHGEAGLADAARPGQQPRVVHGARPPGSEELLDRFVLSGDHGSKSPRA